MKFYFTLSTTLRSALAVLFVLVSVSLSACADEAARNEIDRLAQENAELSGTVDSLQKILDSLTVYGDSVKKSLQKLDMHP